MKEEKNALDNEVYSLFQSCVAMKILTDKNGFPFYWDALYIIKTNHVKSLFLSPADDCEVINVLYKQVSKKVMQAVE